MNSLPLWMPRPPGIQGSLARSCSLVSRWKASGSRNVHKKTGDADGSTRCGLTVAPSPAPTVSTTWKGFARSGRRDRV